MSFGPSIQSCLNAYPSLYNLIFEPAQALSGSFLIVYVGHGRISSAERGSVILGKGRIVYVAPCENVEEDTMFIYLYIAMSWKKILYDE